MASRRAAGLGKMVPTRRNGQTAAAATTTVRRGRSFSRTSPKSASVAHPNMAFRTLPSERRRKAKMASRISTPYGIVQEPGPYEVQRGAGAP